MRGVGSLVENHGKGRGEERVGNWQMARHDRPLAGLRQAVRSIPPTMVWEYPLSVVAKHGERLILGNIVSLMSAGN